VRGPTRSWVIDSETLVSTVPLAFFPEPRGEAPLLPGRGAGFAFGPGPAPALPSFVFYQLGSAGGAVATAWGVPGDRPVPADYDGDGRADVAVWRPLITASGQWFILRSSDGRPTGPVWGSAIHGDQPAPADYDGDGRADLAVWRRFEGPPSLGSPEGIWYVQRSSDGVGVSRQWGAASDVPVPADYDGDGRADLAVWRPATGEWLVVGSRDGVVTRRQWGAPGDVPVPADYDGDGRADLSIWRPSTGEWWVLGSRDGAVTSRQWGAAGDLPVPVDFDGDGLPDFAVVRP